MGVDYRGNFGLGFKVDLDELEDEDGDYYSALEDLLSDTEYGYFQVGDGSYTGDEDDVYIILKKNPSIVAMKEASDKAVLYFRSKGITVPDELSVVGGLYVY